LKKEIFFSKLFFSMHLNLSVFVFVVFCFSFCFVFMFFIIISFLFQKSLSSQTLPVVWSHKKHTKKTKNKTKKREKIEEKIIIPKIEKQRQWRIVHIVFFFFFFVRKQQLFQSSLNFLWRAFSDFFSVFVFVFVFFFLSLAFCLKFKKHFDGFFV